MKTLEKNWNNGQILSVTYDGNGDGEAIFESEINEGIDRELSVQFSGGGVQVERLVKQEGLRQPIALNGGGVFRVAGGGRFGVLKSAKTLPYLCIEALEDGLTFSITKSNVEYSTDGSNWATLPAGTKSIAINANERIYVKATGLTPTSSDGIGTFVVNKKFNLSGTVMSMLFGDEAAQNNNLSGKDYAFYKLFSNAVNLMAVSKGFLPATTLSMQCYRQIFRGCTNLKEAPDLPATSLANACYQFMFYQCTGLVKAPKLPAMDLADSCYVNMFQGCSSLKEAPELPAEVLAPSCYNTMFRDCTSLEIPPVLTSTTLANYCYTSMFQNCTKLAYAPELPADILTVSCYRYMFSGCSNLESSPVLAADTLTNYCYSYMFEKCAKLNSIKMLAVNTSATNCLTNWVDGVASTGTFTKSNNNNNIPIGISGIPNGWTVISE